MNRIGVGVVLAVVLVATIALLQWQRSGGAPPGASSESTRAQEGAPRTAETEAAVEDGKGATTAPSTPPASPAAPAPAGAPPLVDLRDVAPDVRIELRYAGRDNFLKEQLYPANRCRLVPETAERIRRVQEVLSAARLVLVMWDCYRPLSVQRRMWEYVKDPRYVADPAQGSKHNRGAAVDVTLATADGGPLDLGSDHDDFSERAHRDFAELDDVQRRNRHVLENAMKAQGFVPLATEWWHFEDPDWEKHPLRDEPIDPPRAATR